MKDSFERMYFISIFLQTAGTLMIVSYINIFMTDLLLLSAAAAALGMVISRTLDMLCAAALPTSRYSELRDFGFTASALLLAFGIAAAFTNYTALSLPKFPAAALSSLGYLAYGAAMNLLLSLRTQLVQAKCAGDSAASHRLSTANARAMATAAVASAAVNLPLIRLSQKLVGIEQSYLLAAVLLDALAILGVVLMRKLARGYYPQSIASRHHFSVRPFFRLLRENGEYQALTACFALFYAAQNISMSTQAYYFLLTDDFAFMGTAHTLRMLAAAIGTLALPKIVARLGMKRALTLGLLLDAGFMAASGIFSPNKYLFTLFSALFMAGSGLFLGSAQSLYLQSAKKTLDPEHSRHIAAGFPVASKAGFALSAALIGIGLSFFGYGSSSAAPTSLLGFIILSCYLPALLLVLAAVFSRRLPP